MKVVWNRNITGNAMKLELLLPIIDGLGESRLHIPKLEGKRLWWKADALKGGALSAHICLCTLNTRYWSPMIYFII